jgi:hypothetical protein
MGGAFSHNMFDPLKKFSYEYALVCRVHQAKVGKESSRASDEEPI